MRLHQSCSEFAKAQLQACGAYWFHGAMKVASASIENLALDVGILSPTKFLSRKPDPQHELGSRRAKTRARHRLGSNQADSWGREGVEV